MQQHTETYRTQLIPKASLDDHVLSTDHCHLHFLICRQAFHSFSIMMSCVSGCLLPLSWTSSPAEHRCTWATSCDETRGHRCCSSFASLVFNAVQHQVHGGPKLVASSHQGMHSSLLEQKESVEKGITGWRWFRTACLIYFMLWLPAEPRGKTDKS